MNKLTYLFLLLSIFSCCTNKHLSKNIVWKETYGEITGIPKNQYIEYEVDGKKYMQRFYGPTLMPREGVKYSLKYDSLDPNTIEICYHCPIFLPEELTKTFEGEIIRIYWKGGSAYKYAFEYVYYVENIRVRKNQGLPNDYKTKYPNLKENQKYEVEVWIENPHRAILFLDRPISKK